MSDEKYVIRKAGTVNEWRVVPREEWSVLRTNVHYETAIITVEGSMTTNGPFGIKRDTSLSTHTYNACDEIDAALFTGDEFVSNVDARNELRAFLTRWAKRLDAHAECHAKEILDECLKAGDGDIGYT